MRHFSTAILTACAIQLAASPAVAQEVRQDATFALEIRGLPVGNLSFSGVETPSRYAVSGVVATSGLAGMLRRMRYDAKVQGSRNARGFAPARYEQSGGSGNRSSQEVVVWQSGMPRIEMREPARLPGARDADPAKQRGTVDTLTALYATLRDVPAGQECTSNVMIYDGRYQMQLRLSKPQAQSGGAVACNGEYIRIAGFSEEEMAERTHFPFTLHYAPVEGGSMRVTQVRMDSLYGSARLVRR